MSTATSSRTRSESGAGALRRPHPQHWSRVPPSPHLVPRRPLGLAAGVRLLELLAKRVHLSTTSFINIR